MSGFLENLEASLHKGFINYKHNKYDRYKPELLVNDSKQKQQVLPSLLEELDRCKSFLFSVAFITDSGLATLKSHLYDLKRKGVNGRILTSTFLYFNQPKVFKELLKITNVEVRLTTTKGFHSKGYIFDNHTYYSLIVGSSNLTAHALKQNYEWNVKLTSHENGEIIHHFKNQFEEIWEDAEPLTEHWILQYEKRYNQNSDQRLVENVIEFPSEYEQNALKDSIKITPNKMQEMALKQIQALRESKENKGLVISATGTGKTYLSAFDVRRYRPNRMLFIVHREQILEKAKSDFQRVMGGPDKDFGILSGSNKQTNAKYLFATIQSISKDDNLRRFQKDEFDYILIDEVHKAGAQSYLKVIDYFSPEFLLGMTATPERTDDFNIYELFNYNIAYEIRLQEALEEDMLCPFHYFGVTDFELNGELLDDTASLAKLVTEERVNHIIDKIEYYGHSGEEVKGLIFCSRKDEAKELSKSLNQKGYNTVALTGDHSQEERMNQVNRLENGVLDYILTVDIFNEGIDIPSINQVVMLRQTQSSIVFVQQLGRGLRKHESKDFVTIIDFIGNYKNNYLIPIALSGDQSQNKDNIRRRLNDTSYIKGVSTVNFEEIAQKQIFKSIKNSTLNSIKILQDSYSELKNKIGRVPYLYDFITNHSIDPLVLIEKFENYYKFLIKMREELPSFTQYENQVLTMLSQEVLNGKRKHEIILLDLLFKQDTISKKEYINQLERENCYVNEATLQSVKRIFNLSFFTSVDQNKYGNQPVIILDDNNNFYFNPYVRKSLNENNYFKIFVADIIESAKLKNRTYISEQPLTLYQKYSRKDVCRLLNWENDEKGTMYGYKTKYQTTPIFITYHKDEDVDSSVDYGDEFVNQDILRWFTRSNRTLKSKEVQEIIQAKENNIDVHIFVKKDDDEGKDFYYLGKADIDQDTIKQTKMEDSYKPVVCMNMVMEKSIDYKLYQYLTSSE
ncbi:DEAD/DEAH box helicase [Salinibacillus aidingensis]|uniref:DEAD/DEAH box helicase n=1 Tax=Salinibacillus aidingensis TaxID=237684 RepID=A0ABP3L3R6_9BACI